MSDVRALIEAAIRDQGSEAKLARACSVSQTAINKAKRAGRVSPRLALKIEAACKISRRLLCPEFFGTSANPVPTEEARP